MIRDALQKAAIRLVGRRPTSFFGSSGQLELELCDLVNEVAQDVANYQEWQQLQKVATLTGDGVTESFPIPDDFEEMNVANAMLDLSAWFWNYFRYTNISQYLASKAYDFQTSPGGWILHNNEFHFWPIIPNGQSATYPYITTNIVTDANGIGKREFTEDTDTFFMDERVLTLGLVWRWRENKKLDATGDQEAFLKALTEYGVKLDGDKTIARRVRRFGNLPVAWPRTIGPASYLG